MDADDQQLWLNGSNGKESPGIAIGHFESPDDLSYAVLLVPKSDPSGGYKLLVFSKRPTLSSGKVLDARREQLGKPHRLKIYPPIGHTLDDGHDFLHLGVNIWEPDVFAFLDENMRK